MHINGNTSSYGLMTFQPMFRLRPKEAADTFAADIMRRASAPMAPVPPNNVELYGPAGALGLDGSQPAKTAENATPNKVMAKELEQALSATVNYMAEQFGDKAATAMMGLVYKRIGDGAITEESLGNALLDVAKFVDKNFGFSAGDDFINHLNDTLNDSLNAYFDNGSSEEFLAVTIFGSGISVNGTDIGLPLAEFISDSINAILEQYAALRKKTDQPQNPYIDLTDPLSAQSVLLDVSA